MTTYIQKCKLLNPNRKFVIGDRVLVKITDHFEFYSGEIVETTAVLSIKYKDGEIVGFTTKLAEYVLE